jgi:hypothetical protein
VAGWEDVHIGAMSVEVVIAHAYQLGKLCVAMRCPILLKWLVHASLQVLLPPSNKLDLQPASVSQQK